MWFNRITIILASGSPRRKQLLEAMDFCVETLKTDSVKENYPCEMPFDEIPLYLAKNKMKTLSYEKSLKNKVLLTADTMVFLNEKPLGKPQNVNEARQMLKTLSANEHLVITGCCLKTERGESSFADRSSVKFSALTDEEIDYYISRYQPFDKAGSYGIQEWLGLMGIEQISGSFYNVMGLPCQKLYAEILKAVSEN